MNSTPSSRFTKKKSQTSSKKSGKRKDKRPIPGWGKFEREFLKSEASVRDEYKHIIPRIILAEAKCNCTTINPETKEVQPLPYKYIPGDSATKPGWYCPNCGKGHEASMK